MKITKCELKRIKEQKQTILIRPIAELSDLFAYRDVVNNQWVVKLETMVCNCTDCDNKDEILERLTVIITGFQTINNIKKPLNCVDFLNKLQSSHLNEKLIAKNTQWILEEQETEIMDLVKKENLLLVLNIQMVMVQ